jgi:tRNA nucleotidyltransferase (CCA-adding enzyme)
MHEAMASVLTQALGPLVLVGGAVRDRLLGREGADWDLATPLMPEEIMQRAKSAHLRVIPTGLQHGTVTVVIEGVPIEITTFRGDGPYLDGRRPASVTLGVGLEEDLARRDFTINAMALPLDSLNVPDWKDHIIDPFGGRADLEAGLLRAVGDPLKRFEEDGLRPLRACRFASQLGFDLVPATLQAISRRLEVAGKVSVERVFTELDKLLRGKDPARGLRLLEQTRLLDLWLPELRPMVGCPQNRHHRLDVWEHTLLTFACEKSASPALRWGLLLHDVGKPSTITVDEKGDVHFYGHENVSATMAVEMLARLKAPIQLRERVQGLIRLHCEHPDPSWSDAAYRRLLKRLSEAEIEVTTWELFRLADQYGKGWRDTNRAPNGKLGTEWWAEVEAEWYAIGQRLEAVRFPGMTAKELLLDGSALMKLAGKGPGPWIGHLQNYLLEAVVEDPGLNRPENLEQLARVWLKEHA